MGHATGNNSCESEFAMRMNRFPFRGPNTIVGRILIMLVLVIGITGIARYLVTTSIVDRELRVVVGRQQVAFSDYVAQTINIEIERGVRRFDELATLVRRPDLETPEIVAAWLRKQGRMPPFFDTGIMLLDPETGVPLAEHPIVEGRSKLSFRDEKWFERARDSASTVVSQPFRSPNTGEPTIVFAAAAHDSDSRLLTVIAGEVTLTHSTLYSDVYTMKIGETGSILVIAPAAGVFVAASSPNKVLAPLPAPGVNLLHDKAMAGYRGMGTALNLDGVHEIVGISSVESTGWFVVARLPESEALQPVESMSRSLLWLATFTAVALLLVGVVALFIMLAPLRRAARAVRDMARENAKLEKLPVERLDEVGQLSDGFNTLVHVIEDRTAKLERTKTELEASLAEVKKLSGLLPICCYCKKIRDDKGYWNRLEKYITERADVSFSHGICEECAKEHFPDLDLDED